MRRPGSVPRRCAQRWTPRRVGCCWRGLLAYHVVYFCYHNLKSWDVFNAPRDELLPAMGPLALPRPRPAVAAARPARPARRDVRAGWSSTSRSRRSSRSPFVAALVLADPDPRRLRLPRLDDVGVDPRASASYYLIPSLGPFHAGAAGLRRPAARPSIQHPGAVPGPARPPAGPPAAPRRLRPGLGVREPARRRHGRDLADGALLRAAPARGRWSSSWPAPWSPRSTSAGTSPSTTSRAC